MRTKKYFPINSFSNTFDVMNSLKKEIHQKCLLLASDKQNEITDSIKRVQESLSSEGKSTAGDKHETGRAMLQLEREKLGIQLKNAEEVYAILQKIDSGQKHSKIALGSYIETDLMSYYLSVSLGQIKLKNKTVFAISPQSPVGKLLLGKVENEVLQFNGKSQTILQVS